MSHLRVAVGYADATEAQLMDEPDSALEAMARGELGATGVTRLLAVAELARRAELPPCRNCGGERDEPALKWCAACRRVAL